MNRALQTDFAKLILILMSLFNAYVTYRYHSKQFKKTQMIVLCKLKKSDYTNSKTYQLIVLLDIMKKALKSIMTKKLSNITENHHMLSDAQMRARCKWFMILTLNLLVDQIHIIWDCKIKYVVFMLSLDIIKAFNQVLHVRLLHTLKIKRTSDYIVEWACSFLENWETLLRFDEQMSDMRKINADISQRFLISSIFFLFFNASLIEKCKALRIKIKVLNFVNNINILAYDRFIEEICRTLSRVHNICARLIASSRVFKFKLSTRLEKCWVELKFFWKSVESSWEVELKHSSQVEKLDSIIQLKNSTQINKILNKCK